MPEDLLDQGAQLRAASHQLRRANRRLLEQLDRLLDNANFAILDVERAGEIPGSSVAAGLGNED